MTHRIEITDEMVARAFREANVATAFISNKESMRRVLEAALNGERRKGDRRSGELLSLKDWLAKYPVGGLAKFAEQTERLERGAPEGASKEHRHHRVGDGEIVWGGLQGMRWVSHARNHRRASDRHSTGTGQASPQPPQDTARMSAPSVTETMRGAGACAIADCANKMGRLWTELMLVEIAEITFRAMYLQFLKEQKAPCEPPKFYRFYASPNNRGDDLSPDTRVRDRRDGKRRTMDATTANPVGCRRSGAGRRAPGGA